MASEAAARLLHRLRSHPPEPESGVLQDRETWEREAGKVNATLAGSVVTGAWGGIPAEWIGERDGVGPIFLHVHGGGFSSGSPRTHRALAMRLAGASGGSVVVPDYRLAPEYPYPAALDDAVAAYRGLLDAALAPERLVVSGDSAGAALALSCVVRLRDEGVPQPAGIALLSPWLDLTLAGPTLLSHADRDPMVTRVGLARAARRYLAGHDAADPLSSPLFADLRNVPPILVHTGSEEILVGDAERLAEAGGQAGVSVDLTVWDGLWHVFHAWAPDVPEAADAIADIAAFACRVTAESTSKRASPVLRRPGGSGFTFEAG